MDELYQIIDRNIKFTLESPEFGLSNKKFDDINHDDLFMLEQRLNRHISSVRWRLTKLADSILIDGRLITKYMRWIYQRDGYIFKCPSIVPIKD